MDNSTRYQLFITDSIRPLFSRCMKNHLLKAVFSILLFAAYVPNLAAQFKGGMTYGLDIYQRYTNPTAAGDTTLRSSGCALSNMYIGPKFWFGGTNLSFSIEGQVNWGIIALDLQEYKGLGAIAFPILGRLNFGGLSQFDDEKGFGFSIGGGIQYSRTELYSLTKEFQGKTTRKLFRTYVVELAFGEPSGLFFIRYGRGEDKSKSLNIGCGIDIGYSKN